jgi:hypothetical protein
MRAVVRHGHYLGYLATGFLIYFLIYFDVLIRGEGTLVRGFDGSVQSFAWLSKLARDWSALEPPLWDFTSFSGTSFIGEIQTGVLYPGNILLGWLSPELSQHGADIYIFIHYVLAFYFMALFLKDAGFRLTATLVGAYAFGSYLDWVQPHRFVGMAFLPLVLMFFLKSLREKTSVVTNIWVYLCGMFLGLMILAGHIQPYLHSTIALILFALVVGWAPTYSARRLLLLLKHLVFAGLISALFSAPQWLLSLEHFSRSYRWAPDRTGGLERVPYEVYGFVDTLAPELVGYLLHSWIPAALGISLTVVIAGRGTIRQFALYGVLLILVATLSGLGDVGYLSRITYHVPLLNSAREATRYVFLILFASSLLLAVSVQSIPDAVVWLREKWQGKDASACCQKTPGPSLWIQALIIIVLVPPLWSHSSVFLRVQGNDDSLSPVQLYSKGKIVEFLEEQQRALGKSFKVFNFKQTMAPNLGNAFSFLTVRGHRATILREYYDYFSGVLGDPLDAKFDVLGVRYVISPEPIDGLELVMHEENRFLYERNTALPIIHWFEPDTGERRAADVEGIEFHSNSLKFTLCEASKGCLLFAQPFFPGWQARIDGQHQNIVQKGIFMGLLLEADARQVELLYRPRLIWVGLACMALSLVALVAALLKKNSTRL